jgi:hypothetical protein
MRPIPQQTDGLRCSAQKHINNNADAQNSDIKPNYTGKCRKNMQNICTAHKNESAEVKKACISPFVWKIH